MKFTPKFINLFPDGLVVEVFCDVSTFPEKLEVLPFTTDEEDSNWKIRPDVSIPTLSVWSFVVSLKYKDRSLKGSSFFKGLFSFYLICSAGALANIAIAKLFFDYTEIWVLSSLMGAILGAVWNFIFSFV